MRTYCLLSGRNSFELAQGDFIIGRARSCNLVLDDPAVSRQHAIIRSRAGTLTIEDTGSRNAVLVNRRVVRGQQPLAAGDVIRIGDQELSVREDRLADDETADDSGPAVRSLVVSPPGALFAEQKRDTVPSLELLDVAADALRDAQTSDAEWILGRILAQLHYRIASGERVHSDTLDGAAAHVFRLVEMTREPSWLDGLFDLLSLSGRVLPTTCIERFEKLIESVPAARARRMGPYVASLQARSDSLSTVERLQLVRLAALVG